MVPMHVQLTANGVRGEGGDGAANRVASDEQLGLGDRYHKRTADVHVSDDVSMCRHVPHNTVQSMEGGVVGWDGELAVSRVGEVCSIVYGGVTTQLLR